MADLSGARWRKSSRTNQAGNCVEVADNLSSVIAIRDSKNPSGPALVIDPTTWYGFLTRVQHETLS